MGRLFVRHEEREDDFRRLELDVGRTKGGRKFPTQVPDPTESGKLFGTKPLIRKDFRKVVVPRGGIEPPTLRFSVGPHKAEPLLCLDDNPINASLIPSLTDQHW